MFFLVRPCPKPKKQYLEKPYNSLAMAIKSRVGISKSLKKTLSENIEKPYLFLSFDLESISGVFWDTWEALWTPRGVLGMPWEALGTPWENLGDALRDLLGRPWKRPCLGGPNKEIQRGTYEAS